MSKWAIHQGDALEVLKTMPDASFDAVLCDPPYGLSFMGKAWDHGVPSKEVWAEVLRVLKPGAFLLAFGGTRTFHRLTCAIEDAGFEIRDCAMWLYGSGFPKSMDISKALDKSGGSERKHEAERRALALEIRECRRRVGLSKDDLASMFPHHSTVTLNWERTDAGQRIPNEQDYQTLVDKIGLRDGWRELVRAIDLREVVGTTTARADDGTVIGLAHTGVLRAATTDAARTWDGYGTALKPAWEPCIVAMKPCDGTFAENALRHGVAGLNIEAGRVAGEVPSVPQPIFKSPTGQVYGFQTGKGRNGEMSSAPSGRWPANLILDETIEHVWRLRDTVEAATARTIQEFFSANPSMPEVREINPNLSKSGKKRKGEVLQPGVLRDMDVGESCGRQSPEEGQAAHTGSSGSHVGDPEVSGGHRPESSDMEGWAPSIQGLLVDRCLDASDGVSGDRTGDGQERQELPAGAPFGDGGEAGEAAWSEGGCSSPQRSEDGQQAGEPGGLFAPGPQAGALGSREGAEGRKASDRHAGIGPLEVFERDIPGPWLKHFEPTGRSVRSPFCAGAMLDAQTGTLKAGVAVRHRSGGNTCHTGSPKPALPDMGYAGDGGASRFFYCAKASRRERDAGLDGFEKRVVNITEGQGRGAINTSKGDGTGLRENFPRANTHPCLKPLDLCRYLASLILPPKRDTPRRILVPFSGSGSEMIGALLAGWDEAVGIEREAEYVAIAEARLAHWVNAPKAIDTEDEAPKVDTEDIGVGSHEQDLEPMEQSMDTSWTQPKLFELEA